MDSNLLYYALGAAAFLVVMALEATGKTHFFGRHTNPGEYHADESGPKTKFISFGDYGEDYINTWETVQDADRKRILIDLETQGPIIDTDLVLGETVFIIDENALIANDAFRKAVIHIPRNSPVRSQLGIKLPPLALTSMHLQIRALKKQLDDISKYKYDEFTEWQNRFVTARQATGTGMSPWQLPGGSKFRYGSGGGDE